ncbi:YciI family protein [Leifsonia sp. Root4]|uniref:YciI family protein n=1 Tax=Leifsonia sp. Root4 TaxID=1736525 RepID=UPI0009EB493A|nr:YciI family protein [Leifsonia sp. Root4]
MRFTLLMYYAEQGDTGLSEEDMAPWRDAFDRYGRELDDAGILIAAEVLQPSSESAIYRVRSGQREDLVGVLSDDPEKLGGFFVIDAHDPAAALGWAEKCPAAQWGTIEIRPTAVSWSHGDGWHEPN